MTEPTQRRVFALATMLAVGFLPSCDVDRAERPVDAPGSWTLGAEPTLHIGVIEGDEAYQLHDVRDAVRLPDGRVVVANQGTREVRVYAADGQFLAASGADGDGPGQWRAIANVHPVQGDTLLVVDHRLGRHGLIEARTGAYLGSVDPARAEKLLPRSWHHRGLMLQAPADVDGAALFGPVVEALRIQDAEAPMFVQLDPAGRVWVLGAPSAPSPALRVFDLAGRLHATLPLPETFRPTRIVADETDGLEILGVWRDSLDVEHVRAYAVEGDISWAGPSIEEALRGQREPLRQAEAELPALSEGFRSIAVAQEINYASAASYTSDLVRLAEVRALELPEGVRVDILDAGPGGWRGRLVDTTNGAGCMLSYGAYGPVEGLAPGALSCWDASTD